MSVLVSFFRSHMFELSTLLAAFLLSFRQPKRRHGWLFFAVGIVADVLFMVLWTGVAREHPGEMMVSLIRYFGQFIIVLTLVYGWLDCGLLTAVFVATTGYGMQQLAGRLSGAFTCIQRMVAGAGDVDFPILLVCVLLVYGVTLFFFDRRYRENGNRIRIANPVQLVITLLAMTVIIFLEEISLPMIKVTATPGIRIANYFSSAIFALLLLIMEFNVLQKHDLEEKLAMTRRILLEEREQYEKEKNVVEMINVKAHDLKHQLQAIGQSIPEHEKTQIQQAVKQYDSTVRTGNRALDVVLTMKRMICESSDIEFSCMVNGKLLDFMEESDIYSLFGNLLDNAVEESRTFDEEHRIINLSVAQEKDFVLIHEENFIQARPEMVDGLPQTTKPDTANHGFGIRSMQMIAEKYNGHLMVQIERNVFQMDILLPIPRN